MVDDNKCRSGLHTTLLDDLLLKIVVLHIPIHAHSIQLMFATDNWTDDQIFVVVGNYFTYFLEC